VDRGLSAAAAAVTGSSQHREGLVLLANCAASRPGDDDVTRDDDVTQVKVEPEVVLADFELTAMRSPEASFYERKRMAAAETISASGPALTEVRVAPVVTGSRSRSRSPGSGDGGPVTSASGRFECRECGRQFASPVSYNKHAVIHRLETRASFTLYLRRTPEVMLSSVPYQSINWNCLSSSC